MANKIKYSPQLYKDIKEAIVEDDIIDLRDQLDKIYDIYNGNKNK